MGKMFEGVHAEDYNKEQKNNIIDAIDREYFKNFLDEVDEFKNEGGDIRDVEEMLLIDMDTVEKYIDDRLATLTERIVDLVDNHGAQVVFDNSFEAVLKNSVITGIRGIEWVMQNIYSDDIAIQKKLNNSQSVRMEIANFFKISFHPDNIPYYFDELCDSNEKLVMEISSSEGYLQLFSKYFFETNNEGGVGDVFDRTYPRGGKKIPYFRFFSELEKGNITVENIDAELDKLNGKNIDKKNLKKDIIGKEI